MRKTQENNKSAIDLRELKNGMPGITPAYGESMAEAASICLEDQNHLSGVLLKVEGDYAKNFIVIWNKVNEQMRRTWADEEFTTEQGAYGIAVLILYKLKNYTVLERSKKGNGFDYWLGLENDTAPLFQAKSRLEVSGIRRGNVSQIRTRLNEKKIQTNPSDGLFIPAIIVIVEFSTPRTRVEEK